MVTTHCNRPIHRITNMPTCDALTLTSSLAAACRILEAKQKGLIPFFVNCTAGSTVVGAYDPIHAIADICKRYKVWMHVDVSGGNKQQ